jgi:hypothetical protein
LLSDGFKIHQVERVTKTQKLLQREFHKQVLELNTYSVAVWAVSDCAFGGFGEQHTIWV